MNASIRLLHATFDVKSAIVELAAHPELWNQHTQRTEAYGTPHRVIDDIWVRYNDFANYAGHPSFFTEPHESVWYPCIEAIPSVKALCLDLMAAVQGERLGGVLITRIPPGGEVSPHVDHGWHARYYDKFAIQLAGNAEQVFWFEDAQLSPLPGECYTFDNSHEHAVYNPSTSARMTLICCIRGANRVECA